MTWETIISVAVAISLAYWGIWYSKRLQAKRSITLVSEEFISLITVFHDKFETLKLDIKTLPTNSNLYYYKGSFVNSGTVDIDENVIFSPLDVVLPEGCIFKECRMLSQSSEQLNVSSIMKDRTVSFKWDLLKPKESFTFESLIEGKARYNREGFQKELRINQRISDLKKVDQIDTSDISVFSVKKLLWKSSGSLMAVLCFLFMGGWGTYWGVMSFVKPRVIVEHSILHTRTNTPASFSVLNNNEVVINYASGHDTVGIASLSKSIILKPKIKKKGNEYLLSIMGLLFFFGSIFVVVQIVKDVMMEYRNLKVFIGLKSDINQT